MGPCSASRVATVGGDANAHCQEVARAEEGSCHPSCDPGTRAVGKDREQREEEMAPCSCCLQRQISSHINTGRTICVSKQGLTNSSKKKPFVFPSQTAYSSLCICDGRCSHHLLWGILSIQLQHSHHPLAIFPAHWVLPLCSADVILGSHQNKLGSRASSDQSQGAGMSLAMGHRQ